jgi:hypothetical protein
MKKKLILALFFPAGLLLGFILYTNFKLLEPRNQIIGGTKNTIYATYRVNPESKKAMTGIADNVFVGKVVKKLGIVYIGYRYEYEPGTEVISYRTLEPEIWPYPVGVPYTVYQVKVMENRKGELDEARYVKVYKDGGLDSTGISWAYENDALPESGDFCIFTTFTKLEAGKIPQGSLIASGQNTSVTIGKPSDKKSKILNSDEVSAFKSAAAHEIAYQRSRALIVDAEVYLDESVNE